MAITSVIRGTPLQSTTGATAYTMTDGGTPATGKLLLAYVTSRGGTPWLSPTFAGYGLTWTLVGSQIYGTVATMDMFVANSAGANSTAPVATWANSRNGASIQIAEISGADLSGALLGGSIRDQGGSVYVAVNVATATSVTATLIAAGNSLNRPFAGFMHGVVEATTVRTNWTNLSDGSYTVPNNETALHYRSDAFDTSAVGAWSTSGQSGVIAVEVIAAVATTTTINVTTVGAVTWTGSAVGLVTTVGVVPGATTWAGKIQGLVTTLAPTPGAVTWTGQTVGLVTTVGVTPGAVTFSGSTGISLTNGTGTFLSDVADGYIRSDDAVFATARSGGGSFGIVNTTGPGLLVGQVLLTGTYRVYEGFLAFDTSAIPDGATIDAVVLSLYGNADQSAADFTVQARTFAWSAGGLTSADWVPGASLGADALLASFDTTPGFVVGAYNDFVSDANFLAAINKTGLTEMVLCSSKTEAGTAPSTTNEWVTASADSTAVDLEPRLVVTWHVAATTTTVTVTTPGAVTFTGQAVSLVTTVNVTPGAVSLVGQVVTLATSVSVVPGAVTWAGKVVGLVSTLNATPGAVTWVGATDVALSVSVLVTVSVPGAVTWTGQAVSFTTVAVVTPGAVTFTGSSVTTSLTVLVQPSAGVLTWAGSVVGLVYAVATAPGTMSWVGHATTLVTTVGVTPGALTLAGSATALRTLLALAPGTLTWVGQDASLDVVGSLSLIDVVAQGITGDVAAHATTGDLGAQLVTGDSSSHSTGPG